jgi:hypothetical protein
MNWTMDHAAMAAPAARRAIPTSRAASPIQSGESEYEGISSLDEAPNSDKFATLRHGYVNLPS